MPLRKNLLVRYGIRREEAQQREEAFRVTKRARKMNLAVRLRERLTECSRAREKQFIAERLQGSSSDIEYPFVSRFRRKPRRPYIHHQTVTQSIEKTPAVLCLACDARLNVNPRCCKGAAKYEKRASGRLACVASFPGKLQESPRKDRSPALFLTLSHLIPDLWNSYLELVDINTTHSLTARVTSDDRPGVCSSPGGTQIE